jgi:hypothetical protein
MPPKINKTNQIQQSNKCGLMKIIKYINANNILVQFIDTNAIVKTNYHHFKNGNVKDYLFKSKYGVGYIGLGKYKAGNGIHKNQYTKWKMMLERCYDPYEINKYPSYKDVIVCDEWLNYQVFAKWYDENYYEIPNEIMEIDKDLIKYGNKQYCPELCSFVPRSINSLLNNNHCRRGKYPIGVIFSKYNNKYRATISIQGKRKQLGNYSTPIEAFEAYKMAKEKYIKYMANKYKNYLPVRVYNFLINYEIKITD